MGRLRLGQRLRCRANRTRRGLGDCGDKEIGHRTSPEPVGREFASYLTRTMEVMCFDVESTERSEGRGEAIPFVVVARRETDFEVGHGPPCEAVAVGFLDSPEDRRRAPDRRTSEPGDACDGADRVTVGWQARPDPAASQL